VPGKAVGRAAVDLPWLCPNTDSLVGLAERRADLPRLAAADPALLTFLVRFGTDPAGGLSPEHLLSPTLPETAAAYLAATPSGWGDPASKVLATVRRVTDVAAVFARRLAERTRRATVDAAETAARLAPLGWYAVAAVEPTDAAACLRDPAFPEDPSRCQQDWWGLSHDAVARRLAGRWRFPGWLAAVVGNLALPFAAGKAGPEPDLFAITALAVGEAQRLTTDLGLTRPADRLSLLQHLGLAANTAGLFDSPTPAPGTTDPSGLDPNPHRVPLVRNLLRMAGEARRRNGAALVVRLEDRIDALHRQLADLGGLTGGRLRDAKLAGLAELAAGAGHEINNPLAVISGQAQRLLRAEPDPDRVETLRSVVRQTQRIAGILRDLMQFARPPKPERGRVPAGELMLAVRAELEPLAAERGVRLELANAPANVCLDADPKQLRHALAAVVRNGVEAAPPGGWVRLGCQPAGGVARLVVEDSGPGLSVESLEHAFDPFYCGRSAGRGRGLGLPVAWRLVRQNGGDVRYEPAPGGPTRFVVTVRVAARVADTDWAGPKSA
jgi:two-component system NtrC family sensor kinase